MRKSLSVKTESELPQLLVPILVIQIMHFDWLIYACGDYVKKQLQVGQEQASTEFLLLPHSSLPSKLLRPALEECEPSISHVCL